MSSRYWVSTSSTDFNVPTNWADSSGTSGVPQAADDIFLTNNAIDVNTSLDLLSALATPTGVTVVPQGTAGATTYGYRVAALNATGTTLASTTVTTATGNASLTTLNYNLVSWTAVPSASSYKVYGRTSGSELLMATVNSPTTSFSDTGAVSPSGALPGGNTTGALSLNSITVDQSYTGRIGTATSYLSVNATTVTIGRASGTTASGGSGRLHLSGTLTTVNVVDTSSSSSDAGLPPVCLAGTITTLNVRSGKVGVAAITPVETATCTTVNVAAANNASTSPSVAIGKGVSTTTINLDSGSIYNRSTNAVTTTTIAGGTYLVEGDNAHTTLNAQGGTVTYNGSGTITTLNAYKATVDLSNDPRAKTVTNANVYNGATLLVNTGVKGSVTFTNPIQLIGCDLDAVTIRAGAGRTVQFG